MREELSILIPVYNSDCRQLVNELSRQAKTIAGLKYEIRVADDGSIDRHMVALCEEVSALPNVCFEDRRVNIGRAAIRNLLAQQARYSWLLFMDGDMSIPSDSFISKWLEADIEQVGYGGYVVGNGDQSNLRYIYEKQCEPMHRAEERRKRPFLHFHTCNFMIAKDLMLQFPFDERFHHYGYEDVLFGKQLHKAGIQISHLDNPAGFYDFEDNIHFVSKTEEGLCTLHEFRVDLRGYSQMITFVEGIHIAAVRWLICLWHKMFGGLERRNLCSCKPSVKVFKLYKLGYYLTLKD